LRKKPIFFILSTIVALTVLGFNGRRLAKAGGEKVNSTEKFKISFEKSDTIDAYKWIEHAKLAGESYIQDEIARTTDPERLDFLNKALIESKNFKIESIAKTNEDGSTYIECDVPIDLLNQNYNTTFD
jgi:hypothetical protein